MNNPNYTIGEGMTDDINQRLYLTPLHAIVSYQQQLTVPFYGDHLKQMIERAGHVLKIYENNFSWGKWKSRLHGIYRQGKPYLEMCSYYLLIESMVTDDFDITICKN